MCFYASARPGGYRRSWLGANCPPKHALILTMLRCIGILRVGAPASELSAKLNPNPEIRNNEARRVQLLHTVSAE